jgi:ribA/ribD-fused uncharacterized protein
MKYNNHWLTEKHRAGERIKFLFFWGHTPAKDGSITQSCFSQWWISPFQVAGIEYKTAEHWMMAGKARLFNDLSNLESVLQSNTPAEAKKLGRMVKHFDPAIWDQHKFNLVVEGNFYKFSQQEALKAFLLNTHDRVLVEASPVDSIWGIGMAKDHAAIENPLLWKGENLLGYALMEVRDKLQ